MDKLRIRGGRPLRGEVWISGAKNSALPLFCSTLLAPGENCLHNIPFLRDVRTIEKLLHQLGARVEDKGERTVRVDTSNIQNLEAPYSLVKTMRASVLVLGPLVGRYRRAKVSLPGGCAIGARPINLHLEGLKKMGVDIRLESGYVDASAQNLHGATISFDTLTVTGTENLMMAACLAKGTTVLKNAAKEPEVVDLGNALIQMGARISGLGTDRIQIEGVEDLHPIDFPCIPDRIEAGTFLVAGAITGGEVKIRGCRPEHLEAVIEKLQEIGVEIDTHDDTVLVNGKSPIKSTSIKTRPYPGFPTDMQAQIMALMCLGDGVSTIKEMIFENRFMHVSELRRMGAKIELNGGTALVKGVPHLSGAQVMATDLRASACLVLAGLAAEGVTEILRVYHLDRGYEAIEKKLVALGAEIERVPEGKNGSF